ncbi:DASH complex subunit Duo1-domain-containing protein [Plectosphaerella cucumerina]|uniref:DASH complex subunit DUO1 n=1 Tax=Plectosphaerella cucumerina TaxID=40658 RepID=A0A8K0TUH6_9PEZI|nr:DASH complex subunit Duo1-domain-containing protein [Plectosphaerella cucumerina]
MSDPIDDSLTEDIWASPDAERTDRPTTPRTPRTPKTPNPRTPGNHHAEYDREAALRKELESVRNINASIEGVISTLERAKANMGTVSGTVGNASTLLNTWTRILSQTEHNQRLILNPNWRGATQDVMDMEAEALQKQQAAERRAAEEERRREAARRKREEDEDQRQRQAMVGRTPSVRGRGVARGTRGTRGAASSHTRGSSISGPSSGSRIGRGALGSTRGVYRGRGGSGAGAS